jgi:predicted O-linked N-acetylglucosamine transferase (SPINDLY family)
MTAQASLTIEQRLQQALAAHQRGDLATAETIYVQILAIRSDHFDARHLLGLIRFHQGRNFDALELIGTALKIQPKDARAHSNFGMVLSAFGRTQEALESYNKALALQPDFPEALNNRGLLFHNLKQYSKALKNFDKALAVRPAYSDASFNRGNTLLEMRRSEEAVASYEKSLAAEPARPPVLNNLGNALCDLNRFDQAIAVYSRALALQPNYADALNNRGRVFFRIKRYEEALADFDKALKIAPKHVEALNNRGNALRDLRRYQEAIGDFEQALVLAPEHAYAFGGLADSALKICDWPRTKSIGREMAARINKGDIVPPLTLLGYSSDPMLQLQCVRANIEHLVAPHSVPVESKRSELGRRQFEKLRIAYLSSDYFRHATAFLMAELFEIHDRSRFAILGVCFSRDDGSEMRSRLISAFDEFHQVGMHSDREVADLLRRRQVDIAVDLKGFTQDSRPGILSSRPAPVQVTYLGFPGPMGANFIDYVLADPLVLPLEQQPFYPEKIVHLPDCYQVNDGRREIALTTPSRQNMGLPERGFVFCCFNNNWKITPALFDVWMRLMRAVEGSVLWLIRDNPAAEANLRKEAAARSIDPDRLVFAQHVSLEDHLARHRLADLFLDTLPYNAHTTASDALWTGLPIVTCLGESFSGRVAASLLHAVGLSELVTTNLPDYEALALRLASDPASLKAVRKRLEANRSCFPLFDTDRFRRHIESAYTTMWEIHQRGEPPRSFRVEPIIESPRPSSPRQRAEPKRLSARDRAAQQPAENARGQHQTRRNQRQRKPAAFPAPDEAVKLLLVCGPWGSGTTAVASLLHALGVAGLEPYFQTRDQRTVNSYESTLFRDVMVGLVDEETLSLRDGADLIVDSELRKFRDRLMVGDLAPTVQGRNPIFLKHPLSALFLPQICKLFDTHLVYVVRPIAEIEATRLRRDWGGGFGAKGAEIIYSHMFQTFVEYRFPTIIIRYNELLAGPEQHARTLSQFASLPNSEAAIRRAAAFINSRISVASNHSTVDIARR